MTWMASVCRRALGALLALLVLAPSLALAQAAAPRSEGGEANLGVPDLSQAQFLGVSGRALLLSGLLVCALGLLFGLTIYSQLRRMKVHQSMLEISELIYETCKTYLITQGKFILILEVFIGLVIALYFGVLRHFEPFRVAIILLFSLVGIAGSYGVAWFGIRINTFANSRTAYASLRGKPFPLHEIPLKAGMSVGMALISVELLIMLCILLFIPGAYAGPCFIGFAIGESLGASVLRIAGGVFTKIADIGAALMKIVFNVKEDDARNPGVIADCTGDNAGDSVGPSADGFETYGVTGVARSEEHTSVFPICLQREGRRCPEPRRDRRLHRRQRGRLGRSERRRLRDLRRHGRGAHHLHSPCRPGDRHPGPAADLDLHHAGADDHRERGLLPAQRHDFAGPVRRR